MNTTSKNAGDLSYKKRSEFILKYGIKIMFVTRYSLARNYSEMLWFPSLWYIYVLIFENGVNVNTSTLTLFPENTQDFSFNQPQTVCQHTA